MAVFSSTQADESTIVQSDQEFDGATFKVWAFKIIDAENNSYEWEDTNENLINSG